MSTRSRIDRLHGLVGRLEADPIALAEEPLQGRLAVVVADGDDLAVAGRFLALDDDVIAVGDVVLDHRVARDAEGELVVGPFPLAEAELLILLDGLDRLAGGDPADQLQPRGLGGRSGRRASGWRATCWARGG